jgi:ATP-dependent Clp protease ATP-binding subunit ClpC
VFERYTLEARRVIFFARYEASEWGSAYLEPEHLLLGLLREARPLLDTLLSSGAGVEALKRSIEATLSRGEKIPTSVDLPLAHASKRILAYGAEEAERLASKHIGPEHIVLGMLREDESQVTKMLNSYGLSVDELRRTIAAGSASTGDVLGELRRQFGPLALHLTPEIEPAVVFSLEPRAEQ